MHPSSRSELFHARLAIIVAVFLQISVAGSLQLGSKYLIAALELLLVLVVGFTSRYKNTKSMHLHRAISMTLIGLVSLANATQLLLVTKDLIHGSAVEGRYLLISALAIFITNIIMFSLWYWELDSPGLSGKHDESRRPDMLFPQSTSTQYADWKPTYFDYLYLSITNSTAFSPTDTLPLTHAAKALMSLQAIISLLTLVIVAARAVNILG